MGFGGSKSNNNTPQPATTAVTAPSDASVSRTALPTQVQRADTNPSPQLLATPQAAPDDETFRKQNGTSSSLLG